MSEPAWRFQEPPDTAVITQRAILDEGAAVLLVRRDPEDGLWQFLDGGEAAEDEARVVLLSELLGRDPSLQRLADLPPGWRAWRDAPRAVWDRGPLSSRERVADDVARHGWHAVLVPADGDAPALAYTVGLPRRFAHPELVVQGLPLPLLHQLLTAAVERVRAGVRFQAGQAWPGVLVGTSVACRPVAPRRFRELLGVAGRFHGGWDFSALQLLWPDRAGLFPGQPGCHPLVAACQPALDT